jgi:hypothetical protein
VRENPKQFAERVRNFNPAAPTDDLETVVDVAHDAKGSTELVSAPRLLTVPGFQSVLTALGVAGEPTT